MDHSRIRITPEPSELPLNHALWSRRHFVAGGIVASLVGPTAIARLLGPSTRMDVASPDDLSSDVGMPLVLHADDGRAFEATVTGVTEGTSSGPFRQISMHLESDTECPQDVYHVEHPSRGFSRLLVVPVVHPADDPAARVSRHGAFAYQITFVRALSA